MPDIHWSYLKTATAPDGTLIVFEIGFDPEVQDYVVRRRPPSRFDRLRHLWFWIFGRLA